MTPDSLVIVIFSGVCGLTFIIGMYELVTGRMPGQQTVAGVGAYRWFTTPTSIRLGSVAGMLVLVGFVVLAKPFLLVDLVAGGIGILLGIFVTLSDARSNR